MWRPDCVANVWDMTIVFRDDGGPMLGGPESPGEKTVQSCLESNGISLGGLRRARRFPVPGFAICPYPGSSGGKHELGNVGLSGLFSYRENYAAKRREGGHTQIMGRGRSVLATQP